MCPKCYSQVRHRLLIAALAHAASDLSFEKIVSNRKVLHFAPEPAVERRIRSHTDQYISADLFQKGRDLKIDISCMLEISSGAIDLLIACDVLEHVLDDKLAMHEVYRVLSEGGWAIFTVPQPDNLEKTFEDKSLTNLADRERLFGQPDHLRLYGDDFPELLERAGFRVVVVTEKNFSQDMARKIVLFPPRLSERHLATNYRKIFFAQKPARN